MMGANDDDRVGALGGPSHLLELVHALVDQGICQSFGRCRTDRLPLPIAQAIVHQMGALPLDVVSQLAHRGPQPFGGESGCGAGTVDGKWLKQFENPGHRVTRAVYVAMPESPVKALQRLGDEGPSAPLGEPRRTSLGTLIFNVPKRVWTERRR